MKSLGYDIVHVHAYDRFLLYLDRLKLRFIYRKPIVLHYHGNNIWGKWKQKKYVWSKADLILVSTPDLYKESPLEYRNSNDILSSKSD